MEQYIIKCNGKEYAAVLKQGNEIEDCKQGKFVHLEFNDESYTGIFHGIDGDYIMLKLLSSDKVIGLPIKRLKSYFEESGFRIIGNIHDDKELLIELRLTELLTELKLKREYNIFKNK